MNISASELAALSLPPGASSATVSNALYVVVQLMRSGDAPLDPYRAAWGFADLTRAQTFASKLMALALSSCVLIYKGTAQLSLSGDASLVDLFARRVGPAETPAADSGELTAVVTALAQPPKAQTALVDPVVNTAQRKARGG